MRNLYWREGPQRRKFLVTCRPAKMDWRSCPSFICILFKNIVIYAGYTVTNDWMTVSNVLETMWKEEVVA